MTPQLSTKYVFTITAQIGGVTTAGEIGHGVRALGDVEPRQRGD